ncbi:hypothetical protein PIB30_107318, partial [Stylosanthes scabra]|nr:hypothetical protein [Stylosanthes scabra]
EFTKEINQAAEDNLKQKKQRKKHSKRLYAYACYMKSSLPRLGVVTKPILCMHRRRRQRICVVNGT